MATKTINLTGAEVAVTGLDGAHAHIRNDGTEVIYAAKTAGITAGADGVASIPAGKDFTLYGISGTVHLLGTGSVQLVSNDYVPSPFGDSTASGGSAVDEQARTAINAHSGNAEIHVTAEEKAAWNAVNYSNPNLLINHDFKINQRELTTYTGNVYTVDRWKTSPGHTVEVLDTGIKVSTDGSDTYNTYISETVEDYKKLAGKTVTMSICVRSVSVASVLQIYDGTTWHADNTRFNTPGIYSLTVTLPETISQVACLVCHDFNVAAEISIDWTKLEIGSIATPFCPPDPAMCSGSRWSRCRSWSRRRSPR